MNTTELPKEGLLRWPTHDIVPSPFQERRDFKPEALQELAESIKGHVKPLATVNGVLETGIIQPLTVRRVSDGGPLELVCGERRLRAAKLAEQPEVPILLRVLSDTEAENIVLTENIQREDLKPSEEARSYDRMLKLRDADTGRLLHTRESVAKIACKPLNHIDDHLKLLVCPPELQAAVDGGEVKLSVAMVVGRIPDPKLRPAAAAKVMRPDYQQTPMNYAQVKELVRNEFMVSLAGVPWQLEDASLVPERHEELEGVMTRCFGGACHTCPYLSSNIDGAVTKQEGKKEGGSLKRAGGAAGNLCTLPKCHRAKLDAVCKQQRRTALEKGLKVLDDDEAKKQFHPSLNQAANGAKYVWLDMTPKYHEVGNLEWSANGRKWKALLKGSEVPVVMARNPHTGLLVEMSPLKEAKPVGEKALRAKKPSAAEQTEKTPAELKAEEDAKKRRAAEIRQEKIDKITLTEALNDIRVEIERKGVNAELMAKFCEYGMQRAGADGCRFLAKHLAVELPKNTYDAEKRILKKMKEMCEDRVGAWQGMLALVIMSWSLSFHELKAEAFKGIVVVLGLKLPEIERRAKALFEAEQNAKGKGKKVEVKASAVNSTDPKNVSVEKVVATTAASDKHAKVKKAQPAKVVKDMKELVEDWRGASASEVATGIQDSKIGKPNGWTPADVEAGAKLLKAKTHDITKLIGPKPDAKKDAIKYKNWNGLRMKLLRKAGLAK